MRSLWKSNLYYFIRFVIVRKLVLKYIRIIGLNFLKCQRLAYESKSFPRGSYIYISESLKGDSSLKYLIRRSLYSLGFLNKNKVILKVNFRSFFCIVENELPGFRPGNFFLVYNGLEYRPLKVQDESLGGYKFGEFIFTRRINHLFVKKKPTRTSKKKDKKKFLKKAFRSVVNFRYFIYGGKFLSVNIKEKTFFARKFRNFLIQKKYKKR